MLYDCPEDNVGYYFELLESIANDDNGYEIDSNDSYYIKEFFIRIYNSNNLNNDLLCRLYRLEFAYFNIISDLPPKFIVTQLKFNPDFLAELISYAYKRSDETSDNVEVSNKDMNLAKQAYEILYTIKFCPCLDDKGNIELEEIKNWVKKYLENVDLNKQSDIGRVILGEYLAQSPLGNDKQFPHESVREIFEENYSDKIEVGFINGVFNKRGVYESSNGIEEQKLADQYEEYSKNIKIEYSKMADTLMKISKRYSYESALERERATNEL